jgi:hypothetical protein
MRRIWGRGGCGGGDCNEVDSGVGGIVQSGEEVLMLCGGGCSEEEEVN